MAALERQQQADNKVSTLQVRIEALQKSERQLQTTVATELALRNQCEQQLETVKVNAQKTLSESEANKSQLEKELALMAAQYQHYEQQATQKNQQLEQHVYELQQQLSQQAASHEKIVQASELHANQSDTQLLQTQTELRLLQQRLESCLIENVELKATLQRPIQKRDVLRAKLKRY
jgi:chromosome segregation ATPase